MVSVLNEQSGLISSVVADSAVLAAQLKLVGSCRGAEDKARLDQLQAYCSQLGLQDCVHFCTSVPFEELSSLLAGAVGGLHTMLDEHFGISIVEYMAAGKPVASSLSFRQESLPRILAYNLEKKHVGGCHGPQPQEYTHC